MRPLEGKGMNALKLNRNGVLIGAQSSPRAKENKNKKQELNGYLG